MRIPRLPERVAVSLIPRWDTDPFGDVAVKVRIGWSADALDLEFHVAEPQIRSLESDPWLIHRDSCVECFIGIPGTECYLNIESNPSGVLLAAAGERREDRHVSAADHGIGLAGSHMGREPFTSEQGENWLMRFSIPPELVGMSAWTGETGPLRLNLYKCGDALREPHYLSWLPIDTLEPDFHRPEFFGDACLVDESR